MTMADTIAVMNGGRLQQVGDPSTLYEKPESTFAANFLGQSNLFTGFVTGSTSSAITVATQAGAVVVPVARSRRQAGEITVGVRPEKLSLHLEVPPADSGRNLIRGGRVTDVSFSGVSTQYLVDFPGVGSVIVFAQNLGFGPVANVGTEVCVSWDVEHGFGLDDAPVDPAQFLTEDSTRSIATQRREELASELEEG